MINRIIVLMLIFAASCTGRKETTENSPSTEPRQVTPGCYRMIVENDTALLRLEIRDSIVSGNLVYNRFEKVDYVGVFEGVISGGKIDAWYRYNGEEPSLLKQVIFRIGNNELFEGYGEFIGSGDSAAFRFPQALRYEENHPYQKINCNEAGL